jgi:hypothetical protein
MAPHTRFLRRHASGTFIIHNCGDSNAITSWRGVAGPDGVVTTGSRKSFILLLLGDSDIAGRASPKTAIDEELTQVLKGHDIDSRRAERHVGASAWIQHPVRQHDDHSGGGFDIAQPSTGSHLTVMQTNPSAVQRVPAIMNLDVDPKPGRMNGRWPSVENHGCSPDRSAGPNERPSCTHSSKPQSSTTSIRKPGSPTF